jgi:O-antigen ligase
MINYFVSKHLLKDKHIETFRLILVFFICCIAFSIPFGHDIGKKLLLCIFVLWLFFINKNHLLLLIKNKVLIFLSLFIFWNGISLIWSENVELGIHNLSQMLRYLLLPIIIYVTVIKKKDIKYILYAFSFGLLVNVIGSYAIYFDFYETYNSKVFNMPLTFLVYIQYSLLLSFFALLILYKFKEEEKKKEKIIYLLCFILVTVNLFISGGRTGYVVFFISFIFLLIKFCEVTLKRFTIIISLIVCLFILMYNFDKNINDRVGKTFVSINNLIEIKDFNTSAGTRIAFYPLTYDILKQDNNSFLFGTGMGDVEEELHKSIERTKLIKTKYNHVHNSYLNLYLSSGIISLFLFLLFIYYLLNLRVYDNLINYVKYLFILNFSIGMFFDVFLTQRTTMIYFSLIVALILSQHLIEDKERKGNV